MDHYLACKQEQGSGEREDEEGDLDGEQQGGRGKHARVGLHSARANAGPPQTTALLSYWPGLGFDPWLPTATTRTACSMSFAVSSMRLRQHQIIRK